MDDDAAKLGPGASSTSTSVANFVRLVSFKFSETTYFLPDQFTGYRISAWKRSISQPIDIDKRISLITAIFSDRRVGEAVKRSTGLEIVGKRAERVEPHGPPGT